jgi:uncharacterized protein DUF1566
MKTMTIDGQEYTLTPVKKEQQYVKLKQFIEMEIYDKDLPETMTWVKADEYIKKHLPEWRMPTREELNIIYNNKDKIGGFSTKAASGSGGYPRWYWSCTERRGNRDLVWSAGFSDGGGGWSHKDGLRSSCRPVRLVPV